MTKEKLKLRAMIKLINYVKFSCQDAESRYMASAPIQGEILEELINSLNEQSDTKIILKLEANTPTFNLVFGGVKMNLERTIEWNSMEDNSKRIHLKNLISPYLVDKSQYDNLIDYANEYHTG